MACLLDLVVPPRCAACGTVGAHPWCPRCRDQARMLQRRGGCRRCAGTCVPRSPACPLRPVEVVRTVAAFTYAGVVARTVVAAKVGGHHAAWGPLADHLGHVVARRAPDVDAVVPVPTAPQRVRQRGFDHTLVLAGGVARALGLATAPVLRTAGRAPDRGRGDHDGDLPDGAIRPRRAGPPRVLLVDDVLTTGATVRSAVAALRVAGVVEVHVAVLARAGG